MNLTIRFATPEDFEVIRKLDPHSKYIDPQKIKQKLHAQEIIIGLDDNQPIGLIKFSYFWSTRPYLDLIWLEADYRKKGLGNKLLNFLETYLIQEGYFYLMSSSQKDELPPQKWHLSQGFVPCGELVSLNLPESKTPEVFFYKALASDSADKKLKEFAIV